MTARFEPRGPLRGTLRPPPDKSISHRAALLAAMADGPSRLRGYLDSADTRSTLGAVQALGADVAIAAEADGACDVQVTGIGLRGPAPAEIDAGNAGTLLRLMPGWLAGQESGTWRLDGDESIRRRPVDRIAAPLRLMGADVACRDERLPPLEITGTALRGIEYELPVASAQVKSCVLLAGLLAEGPTTVLEPVPTRDHTERMLAAAGVTLTRTPGAVTVGPAEVLAAGDRAVPADFSSAAFWIVAAAIVPGSELAIESVGLNPTRTALLAILERMGADITPEAGEESGGEPIGALRVRGGELVPTVVSGDEIPNAIDELPLVALAACFAEGTTEIRDAEELRRKESDRIETVAAALRGLGAEVETQADGMAITGTGALRGGTVDSHGDHRIAMLGAVAGLASEQGATVDGMEAAAVSYPTFERDLSRLVS
jgi:3-phosphoshikimate 1-carboxyvinyltransferase